MKRSTLLMTMLACVLVLAYASVAFGQALKGGGFSDGESGPVGWYQKSVAVVVGIDDYSSGWGRLSAAAGDARKMAKVLRERGFVVIELYNRQASFQGIISTLRKAAQTTGRDDRFVFFYSGHGHTKKSDWDGSTTGYLVPAEGVSGDITSYISVAQIRDEILSHCKAKHVLLVIDSCFSGTLLTRASINDGAVRDYLGKRGIYGITAGMLDQPAVDGLFTNVMLEGLSGNADFNNDGFVAFKELGMYAEQNVRARNRHQTPDFGVMYGAGQFVFTRPGFNPEPPPKPRSKEAVGAGFLTVVADPWVEIFVDGKKRGISPAFKIEISSGQRTLRFVNENADIDKTITVKVDKGRHLKIGRNLQVIE
jgi:Caspase domain